jgi:hypothetical protein
MDKNRFDGLTRQLAQRENRRQALKTLLAGGAGTAAVVLTGGAADAKDKKIKPDCCPTTAPKLCNLTCTNILDDEQNCGACGTVCQSFQTCTNGVCTGVEPPECSTPIDCPAADNECKIAACDNGTCGFTFLAAGTLVSTQTAADCLKNVCDGSGEVISALDDSDTPPSGACFIGTCTSGVPSQPPVAAGTTCPGGFCDGSGNCVQCLTPATCPGVDGDCQHRTCTSGTCGMEFVPSHTGCPGGVCDGSGACVQCVSEIDCPVPENALATCNANTCGYTCDLGFGDCDDDPSNGCETFLSGDTSNCGACGVVCDLPHAGLMLCGGGTCQVLTCEFGWGNCDGISSTGCETDLRSDLDHCGTCGRACQGSEQCRVGVCAL